MRTYLVAYDLARPQLNQVYLAEAIMSLGAAWARPLDNVWYLRTTGSDKEIEARLERLLDQHDGLVVQEARGEAAMANTGLRWFRSRRTESAPLNSDELSFADGVTNRQTDLGTLLPFPAARAGVAEMAELAAEAA